MLGLVLSPQQRHVFTGCRVGLNTVATEICYLLLFREFQLVAYEQKLTNCENPPFQFCGHVLNVCKQNHFYINEWKGT